MKVGRQLQRFFNDDFHTRQLMVSWFWIITHGVGIPYLGQDPSAGIASVPLLVVNILHCDSRESFQGPPDLFPMWVVHGTCPHNWLLFGKWQDSQSGLWNGLKHIGQWIISTRGSNQFLFNHGGLDYLKMIEKVWGMRDTPYVARVYGYTICRPSVSFCCLKTHSPLLTLQKHKILNRNGRDAEENHVLNFVFSWF